MKQKIIAFGMILLLMMPCTAQAKTVDLGHGSGCGHVHTSACYTSYNAGDRLCDYCGKPLHCSSKSTVTKSMLYDHAYYDHVCITSLQNTRLTHNGSYTGHGPAARAAMLDFGIYYTTILPLTAGTAPGTAVAMSGVSRFVDRLALWIMTASAP